MVSDARKQAWLDSLRQPERVDSSRLGIIWFRFPRRREGRSREYRVIFDARRGHKGAVVCERPRAVSQGNMMPFLRGLSQPLCSRIPPDQLAEAIAYVLTNYRGSS